MQMWLFFTIFGAVIFVPSGALFLLLQRFKNTIVVLVKINGALKKIVITNKVLEKGQIEVNDGKKIRPIKISKSEIYYGKWRRWIIKSELESTQQAISDKEIEEYLNNEDLIKLYLAGKFKDTLILLLGITLAAVIIGFLINGYLIQTKDVISFNNASSNFVYTNCKRAVLDVVYNASG